MKHKIGSLFFVVLATIAQCQLVETGPRNAHPCDEKVDPNLIVKQDADISGRLIDGSGEPLRNSPLELRQLLSPTIQTTLKTVTTDGEGHFRIESVRAGKYRLIASPTRLFQQPVNLLCEDKQCYFAITLKVNPTDMPHFQCPVR